jgi:MFS family permease
MSARRFALGLRHERLFHECPERIDRMPPLPNLNEARAAVPAVYSAILAILASVLVLIAGNSMLNTLIPLAGKMAGFSAVSLGLLGSCLFAGMLAGTVICPAIIKRVGHVKAYAIFAALAIMAAVAYPLKVEPWWWLTLRVVIGFAFAGLFNVIDGWVQGKADNATRGRIGATNQLVHFVAATLGQQLVPLGDPRGYELFAIAALLFAMSIIPFALSTTAPPELPSTVRLQLRWLARNAPASVIAAFVVGTANGSFWSLAPAYGADIGLSTREIATFLTVTTIGSALAIWPIGRVSDGMDRRRVMALLALAAFIAEVGLAVLGRPSLAVLGILAFLIGCCAMNIYPTALAHANDRADGGQRVAVASTLLFLYCVGAVAGPSLAAMLMEWLRPGALFAFMAVLHGLMLVATVIRIRQRPPPPRQFVERQPIP